MQEILYNEMNLNMSSKNHPFFLPSLMCYVGNIIFLIQTYHDKAQYMKSDLFVMSTHLWHISPTYG